MPPDAMRRTAAPLLLGPALVLVTALGTACAPSAPDEPAPRAGTATASSPVPSSPTQRPGADELPAALASALADGPRVPADPRTAAAQIQATTDAIADPRTTPEVLAAAGHQQQVAYRELGRRPGWDARVRALLPARLHTDLAANVASRREFMALQGDYRSDELPAWRIVRPPPPEELLGHYREAERRSGVDWEYLAAINLVETAMGRIRGTSVAGAQGPMQFIPETWARYGRGDIHDPRDAIMAAARYLSARGFDERGGIPGALYSYNNSTRYVRGVTHLAEVMQRDPRAYVGYWHWQVYYVTTAGDVLLPVGYAEQRPVPVRDYLARP